MNSNFHFLLIYNYFSIWIEYNKAYYLDIIYWNKQLYSLSHIQSTS